MILQVAKRIANIRFNRVKLRSGLRISALTGGSEQFRLFYLFLLVDQVISLSG